MTSVKYYLKYRDITYKFTVSGKYTIVAGEGGTGKTMLVSLVTKMLRGFKVETNCPRKFAVIADTSVTRDSVLVSILSMHGCLVIVDEASCLDLLSDNEVCNAILDSDNYYVFCCRDSLSRIPYGYNNVFTVEGGPRHFTFVPKYRLPDFALPSNEFTLITEDCGNGRICCEAIANSDGRFSVMSANGKDKIRDIVLGVQGAVALFVDLCGTSGATAAIMDLVSAHRVCVFDRRSFEQALLGTSLFNKYFTTEYNLNSCLNYRSEEDFYIDVLNTILKSLLGVAYRKNDADLCNFFVTGFYSCNRVVTRLSSDFYESFLPELRIKKTQPSDVHVVKKLSLD